jgi:serine protease
MVCTKSDRLRISTLLLLAVLFAGCSTRESVTEPELSQPSSVVSVPQSELYYLHERERIALRPDSRRLVISTSIDNVEALVASALKSTPSVKVLASERLAVPNHRVVELTGATEEAIALARDVLLKEPRVEFVSQAYVTSTGNHPILPVNQLDVRFKEGVSAQEVELSIRSVRARVIRSPRPDSGYFAYRLAYERTSNPLEVAIALSSRPSVAWADPDKVTNYAPSYTPADPFYGAQFHLSNANTLFGVPVDINVEQAWNLTLGSSSLRVAVIDDGVDVLHSNSGGGFAGDLVGRFGGGYGFDAMAALATGDNAYFPYGNDTHGTSVAGIVAGQHNNGVGGAGVAPNVILNVLRIFRRTYPDGFFSPTQVASTAQIADAINQAWSWMQSDVINNSWGGGAPATAITNAIGSALSSGRSGKGSVVVFAAGNTSARSLGLIGGVVYPASLSSSRNVVSVSAISRFGTPTDYAPNGTIDVVAPSGMFTNACVGEIVTVDRYGASGCNDGPGGAIDFTSTFSGTSAAAPQVSGVAALILTRYPALTAGQVKARLRATAVPWGPSVTFGAGKLNAFGAAL